MKLALPLMGCLAIAAALVLTFSEGGPEGWSEAILVGCLIGVASVTFLRWSKL